MKNQNDVAYLCDGIACGYEHNCGECRHTTDINHAVNFTQVSPEKWMEDDGMSEEEFKQKAALNMFLLLNEIDPEGSVNE